MDLSGFYKGRRVLVTGHSGFKGGWLYTWLEMLGARVSGFALPAPTEPSYFRALGLDRREHSVLGDIRDTAALRRVFAEARPEVVFHLAAQAIVGTSYQDPLETFSVNVVGTASVLEVCRESPATSAVVVVTSDKCYENQGWEWGYRELDAMGGHDPYSASKGCAELLVASYRRSFFSAAGKGLATGRAGNVIGGGDFATGRLVPDCWRAWSAGLPVKLRHPRSVRPWQHVLEPLAGYLSLGMRLSQNAPEHSEGWNFGPDAEGSRTVGEVVERCATAWGSGVSWIQEAGDHPHEAAILRLDSTRARRRLGWRPAWNLETSIERTASWYRAFTAGADVVDLTRRQIEEYQAEMQETP